ncbi:MULTISPECIES: helix-turn-helix domain-containing protein [Anaerotruncus]|uniref:Helix-turn-helix domain-containing protein n=2 Tax=Anaerotruncus TaxID=244127 RepID=A0A498D250_9FIRM|nr:MULTISPECIES: helix-turn-helix transcriptional regulator [Anaerotruncus]MBC3938206.1 helix-turn-helix domain-containing protein [Anaerotruncus massiliensis (ex Togo et al. 2019)]MCQ4895101.1 helix-turn-helix domain-containing protein [Anaerotruncus sp. DFI.9.16]RLL12711.1 helix-turn-helix domain-containing protein [Anaerotruncus massiliensis (ex Liu et al. 2021)]
MRTIEIVAKNLKFYRQQRGLTQEELASKAYTSASYISRIERMVANPSIESLDSIAMALGLSPAELFRMDEVDILPEQYDEFRHLRGISSTMEPWRKSLFLRVVSSTLNALRDWKPVEEPEKTEQE